MPPTPMGRTSLLQAPIQALLSNDFYREVGCTWRARAFIYLLLLVAASWIPAMIQWYMVEKQIMSAQSADFIRQMPTITIHGGEVAIDADEPLFIYGQETGEPLAIIDTSGQTGSLTNTGAMVLLTRNKLVLRKNDLETQTYDLSALQDVTLTPADADTAMNFFLAWGPILFYPILVLGSFAYRVVQVLCFALLGLQFTMTTRSRMSYAAVVSITIIAITPSIVISTILSVAGIPLPMDWAIYFALSMVYLIIGLKAAMAPQEPSQDEHAT